MDGEGYLNFLYPMLFTYVTHPLSCHLVPFCTFAFACHCTVQNNVQFQKISIYHTLLPWKFHKFREGGWGEYLIAKFLKGKYEAKLEFLEGWSGV